MGDRGGHEFVGMGLGTPTIEWTGTDWIKYVNAGVDDLAEDGAGRVWGSGLSGSLVLYENGTETRFFNAIPHGLHEIAGDPVSGVWMASGAEGLAYTDDGLNVTLWNKQNSNIPGFPQGLAMKTDGTMWVATDNGLAYFDGTDFPIVIKKSTAPFLTNMLIGIAVRDDGLVAVSSYDASVVRGAVHLYDGVNWTTYTSDNAPFAVEYPDLLEFAANGDLWVSSTLGGQGISILHLQSSLEMLLSDPVPGIACDVNTWMISGATPGDQVYITYGFKAGNTPVPGCPGVTLGIATNAGKIVGSNIADTNGEVQVAKTIPCNAQGKQVFFQAVDTTACTVSNISRIVFQ